MLLLRTFGALVVVVAIMAALIFGAAGTIGYWQAWVALGCYFAASLVITIYLVRRDPALLERRMSGGPFAEREPAQRIIMAIISIGFVALLLVPGLDRRFGWSVMPDAFAIGGDILQLIGWLGILWVFQVNSYASATIERAEDQRLISSGPYAIVRHPMYAAALLILLGISFGLGSWWSVLAVVAMLPALAWRLLDEEKFLVRELEGYVDYRRRVRRRLIPLIW